MKRAQFEREKVLRDVEERDEIIKRLGSDRANLQSIEKVEVKLKKDYEEAMGQLVKQRNSLTEQMDMFDLIKRSQVNTNNFVNIDSIIDIPNQQQFGLDQDGSPKSISVRSTIT